MAQAVKSKPSARIYDWNGWAEIKRNPISKAGIFPYLGHQLGEEYEPDKVYRVLRSPEELSDPETIESFKLLPWVYIHPTKLLGPEGANRMPAEQKGIEGVTGENVVFEGDTLYSNIKLFSDNLQELVDSGDVPELSLGYGCKYKLSSGIYNGEQYDVVQTDIRGNHLASVPQGRMGPEVAVLDHLTFTFDAKDITMAESKKDEEDKKGMDDFKKEVMDAIKALDAKVCALDKKAKDSDEDEEKEAKDKAAKDAEEDKEKEAKDAEEEEKKKCEDKKAMDAAFKSALDSAIKPLVEKINAFETAQNAGAELGRKRALQEQLSTYGIAVDSADTLVLADLQSKAIEKIGLKNVPKGSEQVALDSFFANREPVINDIGYALDAAQAQNGKAVENFFSGKAA